jgi:hypothetical protein
MHDNSWLDTIDCLGTGSSISHVQIIFSNGEVGGAWTKTKGVAFRTMQDTIIYPFLYDYIKVDDLDEQATYDFIARHEGEPFSIGGAWASVATGKRQAWHCSDIVYSALKAGGLRTEHDLPAPFTSPKRVYEILLKENNYKRVWNGCRF